MVSDEFEEHEKTMRTVAWENDNAHKWFSCSTVCWMSRFFPGFWWCCGDRRNWVGIWDTHEAYKRQSGMCWVCLLAYLVYFRLIVLSVTVLPILDYGCRVGSLQKELRFSVLQNKAMRIILRMNHLMSTQSRRKRISLLTLETLRYPGFGYGYR